MPNEQAVWGAFVVGAFLLGSVPFSYLIGRLKGVDLRKVGSGNVGATNLGRALGGKYFAVGFLLDAAKGLAPTLIAGLHFGVLGVLSLPASTAGLWLAVAAAAVLGHMFSPWVGFKGGKGVATGLGALLGVWPAMGVPAVGALLVFLVVFALWRYVSAASITAAASLPVWVVLLFGLERTAAERRSLNAQAPEEVVPVVAQLMRAEAAKTVVSWPFVVAAVLLAALVIWRHRANIARLANGTELRAGKKTAA
jgi:glycerol-3-phosphate acyltransferase PlsY